MTTVSTKSGRIIKVVSREEEKSTLTESDSEMDERAVEAVKAAINKAKICKKPIAGYDKEKKRAYEAGRISSADGDYSLSNWKICKSSGFAGACLEFNQRYGYIWHIR